jgi:methionine sulfoxide reductase heme-binding subunit
MRRYKTVFFKSIIHLTAWSLLAWLVWDYYAGKLSLNPLQVATQRTGKYALIMLVASLACTPLNTLFAWREALKLRRLLGLYAFFFAVIHVLIFVGLDYGFNFTFLWLDLAAKRYVWVGLATFLILAALAATSFQWWMNRLGKNWTRLHRLVYLASGLAVLHFAWSKKGDLFGLQGDILQPLAFGLAVGLLLIVRIPAVRRQAVAIRNRLRYKFYWNSTLAKQVQIER